MTPGVQPHRFSSSEALISAAGGVALYLTPQDARANFASPVRELCVIALAGIIACLLLFLFRSYSAVGIALCSCMALVVVSYTISSIETVSQELAEGKGFTLTLGYYDGLSWGLVWFIPFLLCNIIRVTAVAKWDSSEKRADFLRFFRYSTFAFLCYYVLVLFACFVFMYPINVQQARTYNFIPFAEILKKFRGEGGGLLYLFGSLFLFSPMGYFICVRFPKLTWWKKLCLPLAVSLFIELIQGLLNTGTVDVDDVLLNVAGFYLGTLLKLLMDRIRSAVTGGAEPVLLCWYQKPKNRN